MILDSVFWIIFQTPSSVYSILNLTVLLSFDYSGIHKEVEPD